MNKLEKYNCNWILVAGKSGQKMIICLPEQRRNKYGYRLLCYDTQYKNKDFSIKILTQCWISLNKCMYEKYLKRVKQYLKYHADKKERLIIFNDDIEGKLREGKWRA